VIGVFIGIAAVISLVSLGQGLEAAINQEFEGLGADNIFVNGEIDDRSLEVVRNTIGVEEAAGIHSGTKPVVFGGETAFVNVYGIELDRVDLIFSGQGWDDQNNRRLRETDVTNAMLGPNFAGNYESEPRISSQIQLNNSRFRVVDFITAGDPSAQNSVIIGLDRKREIYGLEDELTQIVVQTQPGFTQEEVQENIEDKLRQERQVEEGEEEFSTSTPQDIQESLTSILGVVQGIVVGLASIALLVGGIGIMNTMYMAINQRTQEIGVMKAIGASERQIRILFLIESGLIGFIGGLIGITLGIGINEIAIIAVSNFSDIAITRAYTPAILIGAQLFATILGIISGYLPSRKASKLDPADALRYE
jgi:putative ABC transport system permease protein